MHSVCGENVFQNKLDQNQFVDDIDLNCFVTFLSVSVHLDECFLLSFLLRFRHL